MGRGVASSTAEDLMPGSSSHVAVRQIVRTLVVLLALALVAACAALLHARVIQKRAENFVRAFAGLPLGQTAVGEAAALAKEYGGRRQTEQGCGPARETSCYSFRFLFQNTWVRRFHLGPPTALVAIVKVSNKEVIWTSAQFGSVFGKDKESDVWVQKLQSLPSGGSFQLKNVKGLRDWVEIDLTPDVGPSQLHQAYEFDLGCLSTIGGCKHAEELLPALRGLAGK